MFSFPEYKYLPDLQGSISLHNKGIKGHMHAKIMILSKINVLSVKLSLDSFS